MENVYDIKKNKNLNFILPLNYTFPNEEKLSGRVLIIVYLFYVDGMEKYLEYLETVPSYMDILFVTSNLFVKERLYSFMQGSGRVFKIIEKENRGRDVSGLLVAYREEILQYQYICFLHDKKEKNERLKRDTEIFVKCLWENMLGSAAYITNIISTFEKNTKLGVLLPPESLSDNFSFFFKNTWDKDFNLMQLLAEKMKLQCDLDEGKKPLSLGTVFWARVDALRKMFELQWKYEDFDEEPLAGDGTISHAIERCFAYVAQDAGYETGIVMTDRFAGERMDYLQEVLTESFKRMELSFNISSIKGLRSINQIYNPLLDFVNSCSNVYIYGVGNYGKRCAKLLGVKLFKVKAFVVSEEKEISECLYNIPIISVSKLDLQDGDGVIVAVGEKYKMEITDTIHEKFCCFNHFFYFNFENIY